jgi:hypothetical protein
MHSALTKSVVGHRVLARGAMPRILFIIAGNDPKLYEHVRAEFADTAGVSVIRDRRRRDRRNQRVQVPVDRRRSDRRTRDISEALRSLGWVLVPESDD